MGSFFGKSPSGSTTTTSSPWAGAVPYLTGQNAYGQNAGVPGTMPSAATQFQNSGWSPAMQNQANNWQNSINSWEMPSLAGQVNQGNALTSGAFSPNISPVSPNIAAQTISGNSAFGNMGATDPTAAIQSLMSGQVSPGMMGSIGNEANAMYGQATQNLMQQVMPQLNEQAIGAGGYGGSRQGIAQGLALSNMQQNLAPSIAGLYNNANQTAQGLQGSTANNMAGLGTNMAEANAANNLSAQNMNANIGLANNAQALQANQQKVANMLAGGQLSSNALNQGNQALQTGMSLTQAPNQYNWQNLGDYNSVINGTAGLGGSQTSPYFQNSAANLGSLGITSLLGYNMLAPASLATLAAG
ncbi:MAG: hypothetical protein KGL35_06055 [Bradyrhizobium sp.]|nr:hypothetical protein [Bradyrhizobium sp.]